jgi:hypothetical protein
MTAEEFKKRHRDPVWRLNNLYWVKDGRAEGAEFRRRRAAGSDEAVCRGCARPGAEGAAAGISTVTLIILTACYFTAGAGGDHRLTQPDATKKLRNKILFAFEHLPEVLRGEYEILKSNDHVFSLKIRGSQSDGESEVQAGMNARGDTFQVLMISEWGKIAFSDPIRSQEILTGAMPAAKKGLRFIETTWKGAKSGDLWEIMKRAMETKASDMTQEDFHLFFFPWWGDPDYSLEGNVGQIDEGCAKYLGRPRRRLGSGGASTSEFTPQQRLWYYKVAWPRVYFDTKSIRACSGVFQGPIEGAIYADLLDRLRTTGSMRPGAVDRSLLVHTAWDLGSPVNTIVWYFQIVGGEIRVIDLDHDLDLTPAERVAAILGKGYLLGWHYLPHDAVANQKSGRTFQMEPTRWDLGNTRVVPRTLTLGRINHLRGILPRSPRMPACELGSTC